MSIYALFRSSRESEQNFDRHRLNLDDETIWDGIRSGIFRTETHRTADCGTFIEMAAVNELDARAVLSELPLVNAGLVDIDLHASASITPVDDCRELIPIKPQDPVWPHAHAAMF